MEGPRDGPRGAEANPFDAAMEDFHLRLAENKVVEVARSLARMQSYCDFEDAGKDSSASLHAEILEHCKGKAAALIEPALDELRAQCKIDSNEEVLPLFEAVCLLGGGSKGKIILGGYLRNQIKLRARQQLESIKPASGAPAGSAGVGRQPWVTALGDVMSFSSSLMVAMVELYGCSAEQQHLLDLLVAETSAQTLQLVLQYADLANVRQWERRALQTSRGPKNQQRSVESNEILQTVDLLLDELSCINQILERFVAYVKDYEVTNDDLSKLDSKRQELVGVYILLERFYLFQTIRTAVTISELQEIEEGVFIDSLNYQAATAICASTLDALDSIYLPALLALPQRENLSLPPLKESSRYNTEDSKRTADKNDCEAEDSQASELDMAAQFSAALTLAVEADMAQHRTSSERLMVAINCAEFSISCSHRLDEMIRQCSEDTFPGQPPLLEMAPKTVKEIVGDYRSAADTGLQNLFDTLLTKPMLDTLSRALTEQNYEMDQNDFKKKEQRDPYAEEVVDSWLKNKQLDWCRHRLQKTAFVSLLKPVCREVSRLFEGLILHRKFTELGAMQLQAEARKLQNALCALGDVAAFREEFRRLDEFLVLLTLDRPSDLATFSVEISAATDAAQRVMSRRVDFTPDAIAVAIKQYHTRQER